MQSLDSGTIQFMGDYGDVIFSGATPFTLGPNAAIRGKSGIINTGPGKFIIQCLIPVDVANGTLNIGSGPFDNTGTLAATVPGSTIQITSKPFTNTGTTQ